MSRGRPRTFDTDKSLDAAMMLFWRHGYEGTSLAALIKAMKINGASLYNAFGDKESLFNRALERYLKLRAVYLPNALKQPTARGAVEALFRGAIELAMNPKYPDGCILVQGALATGPLNQRVRKLLATKRDVAKAALRNRLEIAVRSGELPPNFDCDQFSQFLITVVWGMSVQASGGATREQLESVAQIALRCWPEKAKNLCEKSNRRESDPS